MVGQWGYGVLESDIALDVEQAVESMMKRKGFSLYHSTCQILNNPKNLETNEIVLAVAQLEYEEYGFIRHIDETVKALKHELNEDVLNEWGNPNQRKTALMEFVETTKIKL